MNIDTPRIFSGSTMEGEGAGLRLLKRKFITPTLVLITLTAVYMFVMVGYRFSAQSAAWSNSFITKNYRLFGSYTISRFGIFMFRSAADKMYRTVLSERSGLLYRSGVSTYIPYQSGALKTVGYMDCSDPNNGFTFMSFKSDSSKVAYIVAGTKPNLERKEIKNGQTIYFLFTHHVSQPDIEAFDAKGKELYYYGYPKNTGVFSNNDFGWHKV